MIDFLFKYFCFILGLYVLGSNLLFIPFRIKKIVAQNPEAEEEARSFLVLSALYYTIPYVVIGLIQLLGGFSSPFYVLYEPLNNSFVLTAFIFLILYLATDTYWIFLRQGAEKISRYSYAGFIRPPNETEIKVRYMIALPFEILALTLRFVLPFVIK